jgi:hypothetical protein
MLIFLFLAVNSFILTFSANLSSAFGFTYSSQIKQRLSFQSLFLNFYSYIL